MKLSRLDRLDTFCGGALLAFMVASAAHGDWIGTVLGAAGAVIFLGMLAVDLHLTAKSCRRTK